MNRTHIPWANHTWNPVTGCSKISKGCLNCYAEPMAYRIRGTGNPLYANGFKCTVHPELLDEPKAIKKPTNIFVCSMSDLFHKDVPSDFIRQVLDTVRACRQHNFLILTKRPERLVQEGFLDGERFHNLAVGVTVEAPEYVSRITNLMRGSMGATLIFVSCEPLLGPVNLGDYIHAVDWVIAGGESGPHCRPMMTQWARDLRDTCKANFVPFFLKQLGGHPDKRAGSAAVLDCETWIDMPYQLKPKLQAVR